MTSEGILFALAIFALRVFNYAVSTVRLVTITRGQRFIAALLAALETLIFAVVIANVVTDLENIANLAAYCIGASVGSWVGMELESRLITSFMIVNIFASQKGHEIATALRDAGYGVTESLGEGREGAVTTLRSVVNKRDVRSLTRRVNDISPEAFITIEEARAVRRGYLTGGHTKPV